MQFTKFTEKDYENIEKDHTYTTYHSEALTNLSLMMINMTKYLPKAETRTTELWRGFRRRRPCGQARA